MKFRKSSLKRKKPTSKFKGKYIIYVEGENTEVSYLNLLKRNNCKIEPIPKKGHGISSCVDFVDTSIKAYSSLPAIEKKKYKQKWLVFDNDGHADFANAIKKARNSGFHVAFSNMCIEYWFLLHFINHDGTSIPMTGNSHSQTQITMLNSAIAKYNKTVNENAKVSLYDSGSKQITEDLYELMLAINPVTQKRRIIDASERAKQIHLTKKANGGEFQESVTTIYELLNELGVIEEKNGQYELYVYK